MINTHDRHPALTLLISISFLLTLLTVVLSAYIRLSVAGSGCEVWPDCYGIVPDNTHERGVAVLVGAEKMQHETARIMHRLVASILGVMILAIAFLSIKYRKEENTHPYLALILLLLTVSLSLLGYLTPSPLVPAVTTANILGGLSMLAVLWWMMQTSALSANHSSVQKQPHRLARNLAIVAIVLVSLQIFLGSWTSANYAGPACPEIYGCGYDWQASDLVRAYDLSRTLQTDENHRVILSPESGAVHVLHKLCAVFLLLYIAFYGWYLFSRFPELKINTGIMLLLTGIQLLAGVLFVNLQIPLWLVTGHNLIAALLLLAVTNLLLRLSQKPVDTISG